MNHERRRCGRARILRGVPSHEDCVHCADAEGALLPHTFEPAMRGPRLRPLVQKGGQGCKGETRHAFFPMTLSKRRNGR